MGGRSFRAESCPRPAKLISPFCRPEITTGTPETGCAACGRCRWFNGRKVLRDLMLCCRRVDRPTVLACGDEGDPVIDSLAGSKTTCHTAAEVDRPSIVARRSPVTFQREPAPLRRRDSTPGYWGLPSRRNAVLDLRIPATNVGLTRPVSSGDFRWKTI